jgi:hypothetical protein
MIPEQIINVLKGTDALLIPPANEGTIPTESEIYAQKFLEPLLALGLMLATDQGVPEVEGDETYLLYNPDGFDNNAVMQAADQGRLAEFVNGTGNNKKPEQPIAIVKVRSKKTGATVRDILTDSPETTMSAAQRNNTEDHTVDVQPASNDTLINALGNR